MRTMVQWENGEVGWVAAEALAEQNPWIFVAYVQDNKLHKHKDFKWIEPYVDQIKTLFASVHACAARISQGQGTTLQVWNTSSLQCPACIQPGQDTWWNIVV